MITLHVLADLENEFRKPYLRKLDTDNALINKAYYTPVKLAHNLKDKFETALLDKFFDGLEEDEHSSLICNLKTHNSNQHQLKLNYSHCPVRCQSDAEKLFC